MPAAVRSKLVAQDLVVVRPAGVEMDFGEFMDILSTPKMNVSAYMEYTSMSAYLPRLLEDVRLFDFARFLKVQHQNIWIGNGCVQ